MFLGRGRCVSTLVVVEPLVAAGLGPDLWRQVWFRRAVGSGHILAVGVSVELADRALRRRWHFCVVCSSCRVGLLLRWSRKSRRGPKNLGFLRQRGRVPVVDVVPSECDVTFCRGICCVFFLLSEDAGWCTSVVATVWSSVDPGVSDLGGVSEVILLSDPGCEIHRSEVSDHVDGLRLSDLVGGIRRLCLTQRHVPAAELFCSFGLCGHCRRMSVLLFCFGGVVNLPSWFASRLQMRLLLGQVG